MSKFSFIHTADLHLGSSLKISNKNFTAETKKLFSRANYDAFARLVDCALEKEVDFLLLAGDVYDCEERSIKANRFFKEQCQRLAEAGIKVYLIAGNHDPLGKKRELFNLPDNLIEFSAQQVENYEVLGDDDQVLARVFGQSYQNKFEAEPIYKNYQPQISDKFNIALLHTQLESDNKKYVPVSKTKLMENADINYWALGHIHQYQIVEKNNPAIVYPGNLQGRDFGEKGIKGAVLVEVDSQNQLSYNFIPTSKIVFKEIELDLNQLEEKIENITQLKDIIVNKAEQLSKQLAKSSQNLINYEKDFSKYFSGYVLRWVVKGSGEIHNTIAQQPQAVAAELKSLLSQSQFSPYNIWTAEVKFLTRAQLPSLEELAEDRPVAAEIARVFSDAKNNPELKMMLQDELGDIWGASLDHEDFDRRKFKLDEQSYDDALEATKNLIVARIMNEE